MSLLPVFCLADVNEVDLLVQNGCCGKPHR